MKRSDTRGRLDPVYAGDLQLLSDRYAAPRFPLSNIGEFATVVQYGTSARASDGSSGVPVLRIPNLQSDGWALNDLKYLPTEEANLDRYRLEIGDILFNRTNGSRDLVGKCEVFNFDGDWVFASYLIRLRLNEQKADPYFIAAFLNTTWGRRQVEHVSRQILMSNINAEEIRALRVPLPDLDTQRGLLARLDAERKERDRGLVLAEAALAGLDSFILDALKLKLPPVVDPTRPFAVRFGALRSNRIDADYHAPRFRPLRAAIEASGFDVQPIVSLCLPLISGFAAGKDDQAEDGEGLPHLRPTNISSGGELTIVGTKYVPQVGITDADLLKPGEVLFNNTNSSLWIGKSAVFDLDSSCVCSNHITRLRLRRKEDNSTFLTALLNAFRSLGYFSALATNFNNQAGINAETLGALRIPVAPPELQSTIAAEVMRRRAEARQLREEARSGWERARSAFEAALLGPLP